MKQTELDQLKSIATSLGNTSVKVSGLIQVVDDDIVSTMRANSDLVAALASLLTFVNTATVDPVITPPPPPPPPPPTGTGFIQALPFGQVEAR
jgi:hypothetical protein